MSRKVLIPLSLLAVLVVACAQAQPAEMHLAQGKQFVPQVVDFSKNVGASPSLALDSSQNPVVTYLGFETNLLPGQIIESRSIIAPPIPNVLFANTQDGYWNVGGVAAQNTGVGPQVGDLQLVDPGTVDNSKVPYPWPLAATSLAIDSAGHTYVAWTQRDGLQYASDAGGSFKPVSVAGGQPWAPSVAADSGGSAWIAYMAGHKVMVASFSGGEWTSEAIAGAPSCGDACQTTGTAVVAGKNGPMVAFTGKNAAELATRNADGTWSTETIQPNVAGLGISLTLDKSGNPHAAYYDGAGNSYVADRSGGSWKTTKVGTSPGGIQAQATWRTDIAVTDDGTQWVTYADPAQNSVRLASDSGGNFAIVNTPGTTGGGSPSIAATPDGSKVYLAWYNTNNFNLQVGTYEDVNKLPEIAVVSPSPENSNAPPPVANTCVPHGTTANLVAPAGAATSGFDTNCLAVPANAGFKIAFSNQDTVPHNVAVIEQGPAGPTATYIFNNTKPVNPGASETFPFKPLKPGNYFYYCFYHPTSMTGTLVVK